jgi:L-fuconolactonase
VATTPPTLIDTHVHLLQPSRFTYHWLAKDSPLHRDEAPDELFAELRALRVTSGILMEATNTPAEIDWLLAIAVQQSDAWGVVGWIDLESTHAVEQIAAYAEHSCFRGVRLNWLQTRVGAPALDAALHTLAVHDCSIDVLTQHEHLPVLADFIAAYPENRFVLNHFGGALPDTRALKAWRVLMQPLAALPNVVLKVSGYVSAYAPLPTVEQLVQILDFAVALFGAERLLYGSNYPMFRPGITLEQTQRLLWDAAGQLHPQVQKQLFYDTPRKSYRLGASQ